MNEADIENMEKDVMQLCYLYESLREREQLLGLDMVVPESNLVTSFALRDDIDGHHERHTFENETFQASVDRLLARFVDVQKKFDELEEVVPLVEDINERTQTIRSILNEFDILLVTVKSLLEQQQFFPDENDDGGDGKKPAAKDITSPDEMDDAADGKKPAARGITSSSINGFHSGSSWQCDICDKFFYGNQEVFKLHWDNCRSGYSGRTTAPTVETHPNYNQNHVERNTVEPQPNYNQNNVENNIVETQPNNNQMNHKKTSRKRSPETFDQKSGKRFRSKSLPRGYRCPFRNELNGDIRRCPPGHDEGSVTVNDLLHAIKDPSPSIRRFYQPINPKVKVEGPNQYRAVRSSKYNFVLSESILSESSRKPIWGIAWSGLHASAPSSRQAIRYFATCGGRFVRHLVRNPCTG
jgi:hypothetical protein